jgi:hypothetical protein
MVALSATLAMTVGVPGFILADAPSANASLSPPSATFTLQPGTGTTETGKTVTLPSVPPSADVEIAIDTTGSMAGGISDAVSEANAIVNDVQASVPDTDFAAVQFKDFSDIPEYQVVQPMTSSASDISTAFGTLSADGGGDSPEAYNLVFHNSYADPTIGWRAGSRKFVVVIGDAQPHGPVASVDGFTNCYDAGIDPNGLDTLTELQAMAANQRTLLMIHETDPGDSTSLACYQQLAAAAYSGGAAVDSGGSGLTSDIVNLINSAFATVNSVSLSVDSAGPAPATASWITLPPALGPVAAPGTYTFGPIGINVPLGTPPGTYTFDLVALADGVDVGHQTITVHVPGGVAAAPDVSDVIQVETSPSYAGDTVYISSSQLEASCASVTFETLQGGTPAAPTVRANIIPVILDDDGNVTVVVNGVDCAPGSDVIEASMAAAPFLTALTTLIIDPPHVTPAGVTGYPANEVETGNSPASGESDVYTVFEVETSPVYAEQTVEISSHQLVDRCLQGSRWESNAPGAPFVNSTTATATLDDDGNAVFVFKGASCAAGASSVIADVLAGTHPTYVTTYTINAPAVTLATTMKSASSGKATKAAAKVCVKHPNRKKCLKGGGGGTGGAPQPMTVTASPNPLDEVGG